MLNKTAFLLHIFKKNGYANNSVSAAMPLQSGNVRRELWLAQRILSHLVTVIVS
jgi:hypothetical protein